MQKRDTSQITTIMIHHSASEWGNAATIKQWHLDRGWEDIGYNDVILNCYPTSDAYGRNYPDPNSDGVVEDGRDVQYVPAGARGHNTHAIHICLIGMRTFTSEQMVSLERTIKFYKNKYPSIREVIRHCDVDDKKPECPSLSNRFIRELLNG